MKSLGKNIFRGLFWLFTFNCYCQSAIAVQFDLTEIKTDEGHIFNSTNSGTVYTPTGLNSVTEFTVEYDDGSGGTASTTINPASDNFQALEVTSIYTDSPIQYRGVGGKLYSNDSEYLTGGINGLSLSTGVNKSQSDTILDTLIFPVVSIDASAIGDNSPDFIAADIALYQSYDKWDLLDINGDVVGSIVPTPYATSNSNQPSNPDWSEILGNQALARYRNSTSTLQDPWFDRTVSGLALELSDFDGLTTANASDVVSMRITLSDDTVQSPAITDYDGKPRTDYAFFASDTDSIDLGFQGQEIPFEFSPGLGIIISLGIFGSNYARRKYLHTK